MAGTSGGSGNRWVALAVLTFARTAMGFQFQSVGAVSPLLMGAAEGFAAAGDPA